VRAAARGACVRVDREWQTYPSLTLLRGQLAREQATARQRPPDLAPITPRRSFGATVSARSRRYSGRDMSTINQIWVAAKRADRRPAGA
jgi:hypothetical protein